MLHESAFLSRGTADQLYLALRLALCDMLLGGEDPCPIVLDDALINFDDARMGHALDYLAEIAQHRQILLFSCHSREKRYIQTKMRTDAFRISPHFLYRIFLRFPRRCR